jgi:hypothetical protein
MFGMITSPHYGASQPSQLEGPAHGFVIPFGRNRVELNDKTVLRTS